MIPSPAAGPAGSSPGLVWAVRRGETGRAVRDVQARLARLAASDLDVDGIFGIQTLETVRRFQRERGLAADGVVGPETWRSLVEASYTLGDRLLWHSARMMRGDDVVELQHRLNQLGFDAGGEDGIFGRLASSAVEEFQRNVGLDVDGVAGPLTVSALRRLHRQHHTGGVAARVRERESMRRLAARGLVGARILVDPAHGPDDPGNVSPSGVAEHAVVWGLATRLVARLAARGAHALLSRGPASTPSNHDRAVFANEQGVDACLSLALSAHATPAATGSSAYYFGAPRFTSEAGMRFAEAVQEAAVKVGWGPDGGVHPRTWTLLRETRMPVVVLEPGYLTAPADEGRLADPACQDELAATLSDAVAGFFDSAAG